MVHAAVSAALLALASGAVSAPDARAARAAPRLEARVDVGPRPAGGEPLALEPAHPRADGIACTADWCQVARVEVPGLGSAVPARASRTELLVALLDRARLEPFASIAWFFEVSGLRLDWAPASADPSYGAARGGFGNAFVRLRLRVDAWNLPAAPLRPRERDRQAHEDEERRERERRLELERERAAEDQRPARRSST